MYMGNILWEFFYLALIVSAALGIFWLRAGRKIENPRWWIRFSVMFVGFGLLALIEGSLLSPYGFGWFILAMGLTLYLLRKIIPKLWGDTGIKEDV